MPIKKGDKVRADWGGPVMDVRAAGDSLAICEWLDGASVRQDIFRIDELRPATVGQQAQQPQPTPPPAAGT